MGVNTPLELDPESEPARPRFLRPQPRELPPPRSSGAGRDAGRGGVGLARALGVEGRAGAGLGPGAPELLLSKAELDRDPSPDRLKAIVERTEDLIREAVAHVDPARAGLRESRPTSRSTRSPTTCPASVPLRSQVVTDTARAALVVAAGRRWPWGGWWSCCRPWVCGCSPGDGRPWRPRGSRDAPGALSERRGLRRAGARARGAGPRADPAQSRGRRQRPPSLDRPGRALG